MITDADLARMQADIQTLIDNAPTSIVIRRAGTDLAAQTVHLEPLGAAGESQGENARVANAGIRIVGATTLDIKRGDRFYLASIDDLITVTSVSIDRRVYTLAYGEAGEGV